ncbi:MAG: 2,3,4,5-tetrahydropyridine-2,6-dicarboxylate N-succinyltransferase [Pseudomonadota bacterium]|nr:2,3,4,5-tetrahydropyridine-2,6-dicarboxylate N-succinyltransferase [Pseudomonadota bacterium]
MSTFHSLGFGIGTKNAKLEWLEVFYPQPVLAPEASLVDAIQSVLGDATGTIEPNREQWLALAGALENPALEKIAKTCAESVRPAVLTLIAKDSKPESTPEAYLKLHLLSHRLVKPHGVSLEGIFALLPNVAWTNEGAIDLNELSDRQLQARAQNRMLSVESVDKFPKMTDYVVPTGTRIADTARVRLGAYVGEGTTIMHEGFINFNAGTQGKSMVEGRISAGVFVGEGSDLGGSSSTMGTLSGGGNIIISLGEECLLGANAGTGIPLGDKCTIESGLYITAGTKVMLLDDQKNEVKEVKARELAGQSNLLFIRNSVTGRVECRTNKSAVVLNNELHANN